LLPVAIDKMRDHYPHITVHVRHLMTSPVVYENLRQRHVDLIVGRMLRRTQEKDLVFEPLFDEPLLAVAGLRSQWAARRKILIGDLAGEAWILPEPDTEVGSIVTEVFSASGLEVPRAAVVCSSIEMMWALLETGKYVAVLPQSLLWFSTHGRLIKILPIKLPVQPRPVGIVTLKTRTLSPAVQPFLDQIRRAAQSLAKPA
jgi:DNA-binding transcriptional LysR family regulator